METLLLKDLSVKGMLRCLTVLLCLVCTLPAASETDRSSVISLRSGVLDIHQPLPDVPVALKAFAAEPGSEEYVLVKFPGPVSALQLAELERQSEQIYTYLPHDTFLVRMRTSAQDQLTRSLGASWTGLYHPAYKLAPAVTRIDTDTPLEADEAPQIVMLHVFPDADLKAVLDDIERLMPGKVVGSGKGQRFARIRLLLDRHEVAAVSQPLAQMKNIFWIGIEPRRVLLNDTTVWVAQSGTSGGQATPIHDQGILGEGQIVGVLDTGIDPDMCYFRDPSRGLPPINACNGGTVVDNNQRKVIAVDFLWSNECSGGISSNEWDTQDHGTHVAGTVAGDDFANPLSHDPGDGVAPGAKLVIQDCGFQTNNCADCPGIGCPVVDLNPVFQQTYDQGARIHTNSWGDDENNPNGGQYSSGSEDADEFMWNNKDFLLLFAAGNSGPGNNTVLSPSTGKNVVAVGATNRGSSAESMASFSSCGPTDDGRIKPDVTMPGNGIISANSDNNTGSNNCNTRSMSGTSMASPGVAGAAALVRQYYTDGWYPSGAANPSDSFTPSAALLKATLINSGHDMTGVAAIPSNCQGWGRVKLDDTLTFTGQTLTLAVEDDTTGFAQGSSSEDRVFNYTVGSGTPLKVTLTWTDFPSTPAANPNIVNDLDLIVTGPGGTFRGNVFSGGQSTTGGSADRVNTVEQVLLANPPAGAYTVTVRSFTVPSGPQPFAVVVTGDLAGQCTVNADCDDGLFCNGTETCDTGSGACQAGTPPCSGGETCVESSDTCSVCLHDVDFESGAGGWTQGADTCTTGAFIVGTPDATAWQPGGGNPGQAFFTANNPGGIGTDDVDGGTCEALSPVIAAGGQAEVEISLDYFHGQRDPNDDANDGFTIEVLDGGVVVDTMVAIGDVTNNAVWTTLTTTVTNPGNLQLRVRATDAAAGGDIVEGGIDNVQVCPTGPPPSCTSNADCDNGLFCDGAETCNLGTGVCEAGTAPNCDDGVSCTVDSCNEATDSCDNTTNDSLCDNGLFCDGTETCNATLGCQAGSAPNCNDGIACTNDSCNEGTDQCDNTPDDGACSNGQFCDGVEVCNPASGCQDGPDPCSGSQTCNETTDVCEGGGSLCPAGSIDFSSLALTSYSNQNASNGVAVEDSGDTLRLTGNTWVRSTQLFNVTAGSVIEFEFDGTTQGEIHAIGFDENDDLNDAGRHFQFWGTQNWTGGGKLTSPQQYGGGSFESFSIPVGQSYTGNMWLVFTGDDDASAASDARFRCVRIVEPPPGPTCSVDEDFESGAGGWTNDGSSTCTTGSFVTATPTQQTGSGVITQVGGDHTTGSGNAFFSATNTSAGANDVDGGTCVVTSPVYATAEASDVSVWYFHGQRDAGGDDFFELEISTNGGSTWTSMVSIGAVSTNAAWTEATATVPAGSDVQFRVQVADGPSSGDLVEAGVDDVTICPSN